MQHSLAPLPRRLLFAVILGVPGYLAVAETTAASDRKAVVFALFLAAICVVPGKRRGRHANGPMGDDGDGGGDSGGDGD